MSQRAEFAGDSVSWVKYGKTYGQLCQDLKEVGETPVGVQIDIRGSQEYPELCPGGLYLIGDIEMGTYLIDGKAWSAINYCVILRYRRLLTAEQLEEKTA